MNNYILVCTDSHNQSGALELRALEMAQARIEAGRWPLYRGTRNRLQIAKGDRLLVYVGGTGPAGKSFYATAIVTGEVPASINAELTLDRLAGHSPPVTWLVLDHAQVLQPRVAVKDVLSNLSFVPKNPRRWGVAFMSGVRRISDADWNLIVRNRDRNGTAN